MAKVLLYLEDVYPGMTFSAGPIKMSEEAIIAFAAEFDPQPFHIDPESAKMGVFNGLAASGWHTAAVTMRMLVDGAMPRLHRIRSRGFLAEAGPARRGTVRPIGDP